MTGAGKCSAWLRRVAGASGCRALIGRPGGVPYTSSLTAVLWGELLVEPKTTKLTIRLPKQDVDFAKSYARAHGMTVTEFIDRYLRRVRALEQQGPAPEVAAISGLVPADAEAEQLYHRHLEEKHGR